VLTVELYILYDILRESVSPLKVYKLVKFVGVGGVEMPPPVKLAK
jgi:hypothetical protein